jgi:hypothetical protein
VCLVMFIFVTSCYIPHTHLPTLHPFLRRLRHVPLCFKTHPLRVEWLNCPVLDTEATRSDAAAYAHIW